MYYILLLLYQFYNTAYISGLAVVRTIQDPECKHEQIDGPQDTGCRCVNRSVSRALALFDNELRYNILKLFSSQGYSSPESSLQWSVC